MAENKTKPTDAGVCVLSVSGTPLAVQEHPSYTRPSTAVHTLQSAYGESFEIAVALPHKYQTSEARHPALVYWTAMACFQWLRISPLR
jgi:hypothetical protein